MGFSWKDPISVATGGIVDWGDIKGAADDFTGVTSAREANTQNLANAREQMAFQERMSNTAYQRAMEDMRKAGLNPMLAAKNGGAAVPSGAMAKAENVGSAVGSLANTALQMYTGVTAAQQSIASANEADTRAALNTVNMANVAADTVNKGHTAQQIRNATGKLAAETAAIQADNEKRKNLGKIQNTLGKMIDGVKPMADRVIKGKWRDGDINSARSAGKKFGDWSQSVGDGIISGVKNFFGGK